MVRCALERLLLAVLFFSIAASADASVQSLIDPDALRPLTAGGANRVVKIKDVPLVDGRMEKLVLEPFDVLAPYAVIQINEGGKVRTVQPTPMRQYRGHVEGIPESLAYFSVLEKGISGIVVVKERKFVVSSRARKGKIGIGSHARAREGFSFDGDVFIDEMSSPDDFALGAGYTCGVTGELISPASKLVPQSLGLKTAPTAFTWPTETMTTMLNLVIDTDAAMYANWGAQASAAVIETFTRDLIGKAATIYKRDLRTDMRITILNINTTTDPWPTNPFAAGKSTLDALYEYGDWFHANRAGVSRSAGVLLSGHYQGTPNSYSTGGIAWQDALCIPDFSQGGHFGGPYAYCGGIGINSVDRSVPDPNANANFGAPANGYWALLQFTHELGHTVQSDHTHCINLNGADQTTYGRTFVDNCFNGEAGRGCYGGTEALPADGAGGKGTIMSYCHLSFGGAAARFTFGQSNEASHKIIDDMRLTLDTKTPAGLSAITAPAALASGASGTASVTNSAGLTYDWTITNGTINSGGSTNSINFTATTDPVTLRVTARNSAGCAVTDTKNVTVGAGVAAPTNVVATATGATAIGVSWTASPGAASYRVYRSTATNATSFSLVGSPTGTTFSDTTVSANSAYIYKVRAFSGGESADSNRDLATAVVFPAITAGATTIQASHFTQLRTAVNAVRTLAAIDPGNYTDPTLNSAVPIRTAHVLDLRNALTPARAQLGLSAISFADSISAGSTPVKKSHVDELRAGVQ